MLYQMYKSLHNGNELHLNICSSNNYTTLIICIEVRSDYDGVYRLTAYIDENLFFLS